VITAKINSTFFNNGVISNICAGSNATRIVNDQLRYDNFSSPSLPGDSGALILDMNGDVVGMHSWVALSDFGLLFGGGSKIANVKSVLRFDAFYGTETIKDNTIGVFNTSTAQWKIDNGNGRLDTCSATGGATTMDRCFTYGQAGDIPVSGDWDGNGSITVGVFRPGNTTLLSAE